MRYDYRVAVAAVIVAAAAVAAAGLSAAGDVDQTQGDQRVAQAAVTDTATARAGAETTAIVIEKEDVQAILGRQVLSNAGEDMGRVIDIVVDRTGQVRAELIGDEKRGEEKCGHGLGTRR